MPTKKLVIDNQGKERRICEASTKLSGSIGRGTGGELLVEFFNVQSSDR